MLEGAPVPAPIVARPLEVGAPASNRAPGQAASRFPNGPVLATVPGVRVLLVSDASWVRNQVRAALSGAAEIVEVTDPHQVEAAAPGTDAALVDMQVGSMGGMAITRILKGMEPVTGPIVLLLDRSADAFLAKRAGADGWLEKPFSAQALRAAIAQVTPLGATG